MISALDIRRAAGRDVVDYQQVISFLRDYAKPRDRIGAMMERGELVRVRKGLYLLGEAYRRDPVGREQLANLIYGPSYVSLDSALSYHGLIPERVAEVTSVTTGKARKFATPLGVFTYRVLPPERFSPGITYGGEGSARFLIATPEKALVDKIWCDKRFKPTRPADYGDYLFDDLRLDDQHAKSLDGRLLDALADSFASRRISMLVRFIHRHSGQPS